MDGWRGEITTKKKTKRWLLLSFLLSCAPGIAVAYTTCTDVTNVYPNGVTTHCKICTIYNNTTNEEVGEVSTCGPNGEPRGGPV
jgi:hypothetical protein